MGAENWEWGTFSSKVGQQQDEDGYPESALGNMITFRSVSFNLLQVTNLGTEKIPGWPAFVPLSMHTNSDFAAMKIELCPWKM